MRLMATFSPVSLRWPNITVPYVPSPNGVNVTYRFIMIRLLLLLLWFFFVFSRWIFVFGVCICYFYPQKCTFLIAIAYNNVVSCRWQCRFEWAKHSLLSATSSTIICAPFTQHTIAIRISLTNSCIFNIIESYIFIYRYIFRDRYICVVEITMIIIIITIRMNNDRRARPENCVQSTFYWLLIHQYIFQFRTVEHFIFFFYFFEGYSSLSISFSISHEAYLGVYLYQSIHVLSMLVHTTTYWFFIIIIFIVDFFYTIQFNAAQKHSTSTTEWKIERNSMVIVLILHIISAITLFMTFLFLKKKQYHDSKDIFDCGCSLCHHVNDDN